MDPSASDSGGYAVWLGLALVAPLLWSFSIFIDAKLVAVDAGFAATQFYSCSAGLLVAVAVFAGSPGARHSLLQTISRRPKAALGLAHVNEVVNIGGLLAAIYAMLVAPVAVASAVMSVESVYMVALGAILTLTFPHVVSENISRHHLVVKIAAVTMITVGTAALALL